MIQYQSFPGATGDSRTMDKLKALCLPDLVGKSFLDVGCNEGFFCGFANYQGAAHAVGIDHSATFVERARQRFPQCEFHQQGWDQLPQGRFDVVLLASALHYAQDQPELIHRLMRSLTDEGVLVLEIGIFSANRCEWIKVKRGIDERYFPTMAMVREVLKDYAWKWMGPSVAQPGDPVNRHVVHVRMKRPIAYLLMEPPGFGKSTIASNLFGTTPVPVISGDEVFSRIAAGKLAAPAALAELIGTDFSPFVLDKLIARIFESGLAEPLVEVWCDLAGPPGNFVMDGYIPVEHQARVQEILSRRGYLPVRLLWDRIGAAPAPALAIQREAEAFYFSLLEGESANAVGSANLPAATTGFVDEVTLSDGKLEVRGWVVDTSGFMPRCLALVYGESRQVIEEFERQQRPDVQGHFNLGHDLLGFCLALDWSGSAEDFSPENVQVFGGNDSENMAGPFALASALQVSPE